MVFVVRQRQRDFVVWVGAQHGGGLIQRPRDVALDLPTIEPLAESVGVFLRACATLGLDPKATIFGVMQGDDVHPALVRGACAFDGVAEQRQACDNGLDDIVLSEYFAPLVPPT